MPFARGASSCQFAGLAAGLLSAVQGRVRGPQPSERSLGGAVSCLRFSLLRGSPRRVALATVLLFCPGVAVYARRALCLRLALAARAVVPNGRVGWFRLRLLDTVAMSAAMQERAHRPVQL